MHFRPALPSPIRALSRPSTLLAGLLAVADLVLGIDTPQVTQPSLLAPRVTA